MNKKELVAKTVSLLAENDARKMIQSQKMVLHVSDDNGNKKDFIVKKPDRGLLFTSADVTSILDAVLKVIEDAIKVGEDVTVHGFGSLGVHYRAARETKHPETGEPVAIEERYVPKFTYGKSLKMAARIYEMSLKESSADIYHYDE